MCVLNKSNLKSSQKMLLTMYMNNEYEFKACVIVLFATQLKNVYPVPEYYTVRSKF